MVNNPNVYILQNLIPPATLDDSNRKIVGGPVYNLQAAVESIISNGLFVINDDARADVVNDFNPPMDDSEILAILKALRYDLHQGSEWAMTSVRSILACDAYTIRWNRSKQVEWEHGNKIYIKFGFRNYLGKGLIVSIHKAKF